MTAGQQLETTGSTCRQFGRSVQGCTPAACFHVRNTPATPVTAALLGEPSLSVNTTTRSCSRCSLIVVHANCLTRHRQRCSCRRACQHIAVTPTLCSAFRRACCHVHLLHNTLCSDPVNNLLPRAAMVPAQDAPTFSGRLADKDAAPGMQQGLLHIRKLWLGELCLQVWGAALHIQQDAAPFDCINGAAHVVATSTGLMSCQCHNLQHNTDAAPGPPLAIVPATAPSPAAAPSSNGVRRFVRQQVPDSILHDPALNEAAAQLPSNYNFEIHKTVWRLRQAGAKCAALQFPEGLLMYACIIADLLERFAGMEDRSGCRWSCSCTGWSPEHAQHYCQSHEHCIPEQCLLIRTALYFVHAVH